MENDFGEEVKTLLLPFFVVIEKYLALRESGKTLWKLFHRTFFIEFFLRIFADTVAAAAMTDSCWS
jgi:hypothetical protein